MFQLSRCCLLGSLLIVRMETRSITENTQLERPERTHTFRRLTLGILIYSDYISSGSHESHAPTTVTPPGPRRPTTSGNLVLVHSPLSQTLSMTYIAGSGLKSPWCKRASTRLVCSHTCTQLKRLYLVAVDEPESSRIIKYHDPCLLTSSLSMRQCHLDSAKSKEDRFHSGHTSYHANSSNE